MSNNLKLNRKEVRSMARKSVPITTGSNGSKSEEEEIKIGRPFKTDRGEIVRKNGLYARQWNWIKREAKNKGVDAAWYQRFIIDLVIDQIEAARADVTELVDPRQDEEFEKLVARQRTKTNKHKKKTVHKEKI